MMQMGGRMRMRAQARIPAQLRLQSRLNEHCLEAAGVGTVKYPEGINIADEYLKERGTWGVLFGGVLVELAKFTQSHPELRKDIDVYAPSLIGHKAAARHTGIDFWAGDPATNICNSIRLIWAMKESFFINDERLESGLYIMGLETFMETKFMEGETSAKVTHVRQRQDLVWDRIQQDTGLELRTLDSEVVYAGERRI